jgi:transcriptional regulator with XRE-family HTH domain
MNNLRRERLRADKSQLKLMAETKIHFSVISRIERGWSEPSEEQKRVLAKALRVSVKRLFPSRNKRIQ